MKQPKRFPVSVHPPIIIYEANGYGNNQREIEKNKKKCSILSCFCILTYYKIANFTTLYFQIPFNGPRRVWE